MKFKFSRFLLASALALYVGGAVSGCGLAAVIYSSVGDLAAGPQRRAQMLDGTLSHFHRAIVWGSHPDAAAFVMPEAQRTFFKEFRRGGKNTHIVDVEVKDVIFDDDEGKAYVDVSIRQYEKPIFTVESKDQTEVWQFNRFSGWRLSDPNYHDSEGGPKSAGEMMGVADANAITPTP
jgi:hypothetical protein